jgi:hypothetical protein
VQLARDAGFVQEHLHELTFLREVREDALDDDEAVFLRVFREIELRHPTHSEALEQEVLAERDGRVWS